MEDLFKASHCKKKVPWSTAQPVYNELSRLVGGGMNGVDHAIGLSSGNFTRYIKEGEITLISFNAMKGALADHQVPEAGDVCPFNREDLTRLLVMVADNDGQDSKDLIIKIAKALGNAK